MPDGYSVRPTCPETNSIKVDSGTSCLRASETPTPVGHDCFGGELLAALGDTLPDSASVGSEYTPDLGTNQATLEMYDKYFEGAKGALLKTRIETEAGKVGLNPGLLASTMFAEDKVSSYTKGTGEVDGVDIGVDDYKERKVRIERRVPAARNLKPTRYDAYTNENGRLIPEVPYFKAADAVLATAVYLKYGELMVRDALFEMGGSFDRLPIEYRFALTRYAMNTGPGAVRSRAMEMLGITLQRGKYIHSRTGKDFFDYKSGSIKQRVEQFNRHHPRRAATVHTAQAIHLSEKIFGINPAAGDDSPLFFR
jgi:hypothetical protein